MGHEREDAVMRALAYPFARMGLSWPAAGRSLLVNAVPDGAAGAGKDVPWRADTCAVWQWWKGPAEIFAAQGFAVSALCPPPGPFAAALVRLPPQREEGLAALAAAYDALAPGGVFVAAAANDAGAGRLEKDLAAHLPGMQAAAKYKCRVVWGVKGDGALPAAWRAGGVSRAQTGTGLLTRPGLFSWDRVDPASRLLLSCLSAAGFSGFTGSVADLGCGIGVIADHVLKTAPGVSSVLCLDADARAVSVCAENLAARHPGRAVSCVWADLSRRQGVPQVDCPVDCVVMNPPFHAGKAQAIALGRSFIDTAAGLLRPGGTLWMVANAHLPYEEALEAAFRTVEKPHAGGGFKIFHARR